MQFNNSSLLNGFKLYLIQLLIVLKLAMWGRYCMVGVLDKSFLPGECHSLCRRKGGYGRENIVGGSGFLSCGGQLLPRRLVGVFCWDVF